MGAVSRVAIAVRMLAVALLPPLAVLVGQHQTGRALAAVVCFAGAFTLLTITGRFRQSDLTVVEGALVGVLAAVSYRGGSDALPYLMVPLFLGGFTLRFRGLLQVLVAMLVLGGATWVVVEQVPALAATLPPPSGRYVSFALAETLLVVWVGVGAAVGLLGALLHDRGYRQSDNASYRDAIGLIQQLDEVSGRLSGGLDPVTLAEEMMAEADVSLPVQQSAVFARSGTGVVSPLRYSTFTAPRSFGGLEDFVENCWRSDRPLLRATTAGIPLRTGPRTLGVLVLELAHPVDQRALFRLQQALAGPALRLQAALLFDNVRAHATSEERNRLAREVHDGVAQDVASLGYMVDGLSAGATSPQQRDQMVALRTEVTRVVAELRASVYDLRNEMRAGQGLGQGVSAFARQIGSRSDLTVHVRLDEGATRLRTDIEAELLRIAQEAMNNARKHSGGQNLWVNCTVRPPYAEIEVVDDGDGLKRARHDSHGLRIMRERAENIGAKLVVENLTGEATGTRLRVRLSS